MLVAATDVMDARIKLESAMLAKILCKLGIHRVGDWAYCRAERCNQTQICEICGAVNTRIAHLVENWKQENILFSEVEGGVCVRCDQLQAREVPCSGRHDRWGRSGGDGPQGPD